MFRINLLPKEVLERRKYEGGWRWVAIIGVGLAAIILLIWVGLRIEVSLKTGDLQTVEEQSKSTTVQADQLSIFQGKEDDLLKRQTIAQTALQGRVNIGQVANDISLVLPDEVWLDLLTINESTGLIMSANTPRTTGETTDVAYKSVAKTLVRLNDLSSIYDVWLGTATNATWSQWAPKADVQGTPLPLKVVTFQATGKVFRPGASSGASGTAGSSEGTHTVGAANAAQGAVNAANGASAGSGQ
jgi:Tfp pilus assembly protein PilN